MLRFLCVYSFKKLVCSLSKGENEQSKLLTVVQYSTFQVLVGKSAQIVQANITAENGFVHIINQVRNHRSPWLA